MFGGLQKFSLIDYPKEISAVVFTLGCNFRCPYCHNPELVNKTAEPIKEDEIINFLKRRVGKLSAVSITGGEPTIHREKLIKFIEKLKCMGFKVKLDTNGSNPHIVKQLLKSRLIDYIAVDIKAPLEKYQQITKSSINPETISQTIKIVLESGIEHEFRTTVVKDLLTEEDIEKILKTIRGANLYVIQNFIPSKTLDESFINAKGFEGETVKSLTEKAKGYVKKCIAR